MEGKEQNRFAKSAPTVLPSPGEAFLQALYDGIIEAVVGVNTATQEIIHWSKGAVQQFGYSGEEVLQQRASCIHVDDAAFERFLASSSPIVADRGYWSGEWELRRRDGTRFSADITVSTFLQSEDEHAYVVIVIRDITERKLAEALIQRRNLFVRLHQLIAECANEASSSAEALGSAIEYICSYLRWPVGHCFLATDADSNPLVSAPLWHLADRETFKGFQEATDALALEPGTGLVGRVWATGEPVWIPDATKDPSFRRGKAAAAAGLKAAVAFPVLVHDRVRAVLEFFSTEAVEPEEPLLDVMGHLGKQLGIVYERERTGKGLSLKAASLELLNEIASTAMESSSVEEALQATVNNVCRYTGWCIGHAMVSQGDAMRQLTSSSVWCLADPRFEPFRQTFRQSPHLTEDALGFRVVESDNGVWITDLSADSSFPGARVAASLGLRSAFVFPVRLANRIVAVLAFLSTDALPPHNSVLDIMANIGIQLGLIFERNKNEQDAIEKERLAAIGAAAARLAHEIRNPLNGMYTVVQVLQRDLARKEKADDWLFTSVGDLSQEIERLNRLLDDFRDLARPERLNIEAFFFESLLEEMLAAEGALLTQQGIEPVLDIQPEVPMISADRDKLKQALLHLLHNAVEAMPDGGTITFRQRSEGETIILEVQDTGVGIPNDIDVFELFTTTGKGSGLGLPIVRQIATAHGGTITLTTESNRGTTLRLALPLKAL